jgi:hypothetical protein
MVHQFCFFYFAKKMQISDFQHVFSTRKNQKRQCSTRMANLLRKMVGATGIEPVTPAVYGGMPKGDPAIEMVIREVMTTMLDAQQDVPRD